MKQNRCHPPAPALPLPTGVPRICRSAGGPLKHPETPQHRCQLPGDRSGLAPGPGLPSDHTGPPAGSAGGCGAGWGQTEREEARPNGAGQSRAGPNGAGRCRAGPGGAGQSRAGPSDAEAPLPQSRAGPRHRSATFPPSASPPAALARVAAFPACTWRAGRGGRCEGR